jgi:1,4-alpha-glucan branching enzyme
MAKGFFALVLHAHLPYVRHPEYENFLEEDWLYEALTETYIPLLEVFNGLVKDNVEFKISMSITPPLTHMLTDPLLQERYMKYLNKLIELGHREVERTKFIPEFNQTAQIYLSKFEHIREVYVNKYKMNLIKAFKELQDIGYLEIITCGATHGFLPLLEINKNSINAQISVAKQSYMENFDRPPKGIWNGECGYYQGLESILKKHNIRFFFVDTHGILHADKRPKYGVYAPLYTKNGVAVFGRDIESSQSVWSSKIGYPGDPDYREFYRDIGFDLSYDYIKDYIHPDGIRIMTGYKYYRITGKTEHKEPYNYHRAVERAAEHAGNFMFNREKQIEYLSSIMDRQPIVISPYDAELFGHWWYEGPHFIDFLCRKIYYDQDNIKMISPSDYLEMYPRNQVATPSISSWGKGGYGEVWLEGSNDWIYRHLHKIADRMVELANTYYDSKEPVLIRALNQCAREVLLAQSSDWAFIMKTGTMVEYAHKRTKDHVNRFNELYDSIKENRINRSFLENFEWKDNIFPNIDFRVFSDKALND